MNQEDVKEIHLLLMAFMGAVHEKFFIRMRKQNMICGQFSKNQFKIMNVLHHHNDITSTEIGKMLDVEKGSLTTMVDHLESMGMLTRTIDNNDRRRVLLSLSTRGQEHMDKTMLVYSAALADLFQDVDPGEMESFVNSLRYLVDFTAQL